MSRPSALRGRLPSRVAVIGDVGGHLTELEAELTRLGADPGRGVIPPDLVVVQVGDLVHRGPDSEHVVALVDRCLHVSPGHWIQLVGNHEAHYLRRPVFDWPQRIDHHAIDTLRSWWATGAMCAATVVTHQEEDLLVTHAGLTVRFWRDVLGSPTEARAAAEALNSMARTGVDVLFRGGSMLGGGPARLDAGPLWARAATELVPGWLLEPMPFGQVHGHSSVYDWEREQFRAEQPIPYCTDLDPEGGHETTHLDGGVIVGVDPGHGPRARNGWRAWEPQLAMPDRTP